LPRIDSEPMADRTAELHELANYRHGRVPRELRERQLLAIAEDLFAERGYQRASMDELARRAGVSKPLIYELFSSKDELHRRLFERAADELASAVATSIAPDGCLEATLREGAVAFFRFIDNHRAAWAMLYADEGGAPHTPHLNEIRARQTSLVAGLLTSRAQQLDVAIDPNHLEAVANAINGAFEWMAHWWRANPDVEPETLAGWLVELVVPGVQRLVGRGE
jgi:AcrR family transcriptional regulator